jgi:hypothetical protein
MLAREQPTAAALAAANEMDPAATGLSHASTLATGAAGAVRAIEKAGAPQGAPPSLAGADISKLCVGAPTDVGVGDGAHAEMTGAAQLETRPQNTYQI